MAPVWTVPVFDEPDRVTPQLVIAVVLLGLASFFHVGAGLFVSLFTTGVDAGLIRLLPGFQLIFGVIAAVSAYRVWEADISGPVIAVILGVAAIVLTIVLTVLSGSGLPSFLTAALLVPAFLDVVGGAFGSVAGAPEEEPVRPPSSWR